MERGVKTSLVVILFLSLIIFLVISFVNGEGDNLHKLKVEEIDELSQASVADANEDNTLENLDPLSKKLKDTTLMEGTYLKDKTIVESGLYDFNLPKNILSSSKKFLKSFINSDDLDKNVYLKEWALLKDSSSNSEVFLLTYDFKIESIRQNGKKTISEYALKMIIDGDGKIIDEFTPKNKYSLLKERNT